MTEKQLEQKLVQAVKNKKGIAYKFTSPSHNGVPDRLVILPDGKTGFVEVKKPGDGKLSKSQIRELYRLTDLGCKCYVLENPIDITAILLNIESDCSLNVYPQFKAWFERK